MINSLSSFVLILIVYTLTLTGCQPPANNNSWKLISPDGELSWALQLVDEQLFYHATSIGDTVIEKSRLGIIRADTDLSTGLQFVAASEPVDLNNEIELITGKQVRLLENGKLQSFKFKNKNGDLIVIECKLYDDGFALRYVFPETSSAEVIVREDLTEFSFSADTRTWLQPYDEVTQYTPAYEKNYENNNLVGEASEFENGWCFPALFKTKEKWLLISDAGIDGNYTGSHLHNDPNSSVYKLRWPEKEEAKGVGISLPFGVLPWQTSWKCIAIGDLNSIVNSDLVKLVSSPNQVEDTSWIKPGRASWSWLSDHDSPQDFNKLKAFVDLSSEMTWEYSLVDANWNNMKGGDIKQLVDYAATKGVGILMWYNSGGSHNDVTEAPRDIMSNPLKRKQEFKKLNSWGVKGVKIDFFQSDKQFIMELYKNILKDAAEYQIMVNFHGCTIPRGWSRTYPNLITMESVRGAENYTFSEEYVQKAPELNAILPFTRNVVGSMDYTPVIFTDMKYPHITSYGHEIALAVIFESGWLHFGDGINGYKSLGQVEKDFLRNIPVTWDEIRLLHGTPGEDVVLARRKGNDWYIAGINGENEHKELDLELSFLTEEYSVIRISDGKHDKELTINIGFINDLKKIEMLPYGGFAMRLTQKN